MTRVAVVANLVAVAALSAAFAFSQNLFAFADETAHLDYAFQVWHGNLPVFEHGLLIDPPFGVSPPVQWTAQHPPLFYLYEAPFVGPFLDRGDYLAGGYAGRLANVLLACAVVAAIMWAARAIVPGRPALALAAGTVTAAMPTVVGLAGQIRNDNMLVLWTALLIGLVARMLRAGPTPLRLVLFALVSSAALLTRSSGAIVVGICGLVLGVTLLLRRPPDWRALFGLSAAGLVPLAACGWFYARNVQLTGNLVGGHFDYLARRVARPFAAVAADPEVWRQWHAIYGYDVISSSVVAAVLVGLPLAAASVLTVVHLRRRGWQANDVAIVTMLVALVVVTIVMQIQYVAVRGGASWRYLMPITPVIAVAIAGVITASRRLMPWLLTGWVALAVLPLVACVARTLTTGLPTSDAPLLPGPALLALAVGLAALLVAIVAQTAFSRSTRNSSGPEASVAAPAIGGIVQLERTTVPESEHMGAGPINN